MKAVLLLLVLLVLLAAAASAQTSSSYTLAGLPLFNAPAAAQQHAHIDLDVRDMLAALTQGSEPDYAQAKQVYTHGGNALPATLQDLATSFTNPEHQVDAQYFQQPGHAGAYVLAALDGTGAMAGLPHEMRVAAIKLGVRALVTNMEAVEQLWRAVRLCEEGSSSVAAAEAVDLAWAYYVGSLEGGALAGAGGVLGFDLAAKKCALLGTCTGTSSSSSTSFAKANNQLAVLVSRAALLVQRENSNSDGECQGTRAAVTAAVRQMRVPLVQGLVRALYDLAALSGGTSVARRTAHAEAWTLLQTLAAPLAKCDARTANALFVSLDITLEQPLSSAAAAEADALVTLLQQQYSCLGVTCSDVGALTDRKPCSSSTSTSFSYNLQEYRFRRDVLDVASIDLDVRDVQNRLSSMDFAGAETVYMQGLHSVHPTTGQVRSLHGLASELSSSAASAGEPVLTTFSTYYGGPYGQFAGDFVLHALRGTGQFDKASQAFRRQAAQRGVVHSVLWHSVQHRLQQAIKACRASASASTSTSSTDAAVQYVDEAWALHTGLSANYSLFAGNVAECTATNACVGGSSRRSLVNDRLVALFTTAQTAAALQDCATLASTVPLVKQHMTVQPVQNMLRLMANIVYPTQSDEDWASAWTSAFGVLPIVHACDAEAARVVRSNLDPTRTFYSMQLANAETDISHMMVSAFKCMRITCEQVGGGSLSPEMERFCPSTTTGDGGSGGSLLLEGAFGMAVLPVGAQVGIALACIVVWALSLYAVFRTARRHGAQTKLEAVRRMAGATDTSLIMSSHGVGARRTSFLE